jgi:hypothetical protein
LTDVPARSPAPARRLPLALALLAAAACTPAAQPPRVINVPPTCGLPLEASTLAAGTPRLFSQAWITVTFRDEIGSSFVLKQAELSLDDRIHCFLRGPADRHAVELQVAGDPSITDEPPPEAKSSAAEPPERRPEELLIFDGAIPSGEHTLIVSLVYRGHGAGVFSYLKGYTFNVRSSQRIDAKPGEATTIRVAATERGGPTTPLEERPSIRYDVRSSRR